MCRAFELILKAKSAPDELPLFIAPKMKKIQKQEFCLKLMNVKKAKNMFNHPEGGHPRPQFIKKVNAINLKKTYLVRVVTLSKLFEKRTS